MKLKHLLMTFLAAPFVLGGWAQAGIILQAGSNTFQDDNLEYVYVWDADNEVEIIKGAAGSGDTLKVGDRLAAVVTFTDLNGVTPLGAGIQELTGYSVLVVKEFTATGGVIFEAAPEFEAKYGTGALVALYEQDPGNFERTCFEGTDTCIADATDGNLWMVVGIGTDADDFWSARPNEDVLGTATLETVLLENLRTIGDQESFGTASFGLSILTNNTGYEFAQVFSLAAANRIFSTGGDGFVDLSGSGALQGGGASINLTSPWLATSDFQFRVEMVPVPEPAVLSLFGLGLLGLAFATRRRLS